MRQDNIQMLSDTLGILNAGAYSVCSREVPLKLSPGQMRRSQVFLPREIDALNPESTVSKEKTGTPLSVTCQNADSFVVARERSRQRREQMGEDCSHVLVLNLANPVNPGGGVRRGARAQEEDLCRKSSLLLSLENEAAKPYYRYNRNLHTYMGSDAIIITPEVEIIRDGAGNLLEDSVLVSVMTCAAPMLSRGMEGLTDKEYRQLVFHRITGMLRVAAWLGYDALVLGGKGAIEKRDIVVNALPDGQTWLKSFKVGDATYYLSLVNPLDFKTGTNTITAYVSKKSEKATVPYALASETFTIDIDPRMPDMGNHTSPDNTPLTKQADGSYAGTINLTMTGLWRIHLTVRDAEGNVVAGGEELSSLYWDVTI
jgi:uncharacterized protein (TIGR02452 family)